MNSTPPLSAIKGMCDMWFGLGDALQHEPVLFHADRDEFSDHDLIFTFEGAGGVPVESRCDATFFLGRLWEDRVTPELFRSSHVRSSNDDIAVLGMNFFWGAFVQFGAPYHDSGSASIRFAAQSAVTGDQKIHGPWDFTFTQGQ